MTDNCCRPIYTSSDGTYNATQVRLYGIPGIPIGGPQKKAAKLLDPFINMLEALKGAFPSIPSAVVRIATKIPEQFIAVFAVSSDSKRNLTTGVIFSYAYEGHCYDLPKPKIMVLPTEPQAIPEGDCGYSGTNLTPGPGKFTYMVWVVDKLSECVDIDVAQGFVEQLVLEANLPGKRSPTMYAAKAIQAHRGGRLAD